MIELGYNFDKKSLDKIKRFKKSCDRYFKK